MGLKFQPAIKDKEHTSILKLKQIAWDMERLKKYRKFDLLNS